VVTVQGKMLAAKRAADRASEPLASIAQNKRIGACHPQRSVHQDPDALSGRFVERFFSRKII
jgi:hypothetical protein